MIVDSYGRPITYLRLAVTDRCNLRCMYCMPEKGLDWIPRRELMSFDEMFRLCSIFTEMGVNKIRITGGEPFLRNNLMEFLTRIASIDGFGELSITTNGFRTADSVPDLKKIGVKCVNLSLDTLDKDRFIQITRRDGLAQVLKTFDALLTHGIQVKINVVVMGNMNTQDIIPMVKLADDLPVSVRFIEEMPFNGDVHRGMPTWDHLRIYKHIEQHYPMISKMETPRHATAYAYKIPGQIGDIGIIAAYTRLFCGSCNRIRITPTGVLRTCLYDGGSLNLKEAMQEGLTDEELKHKITNAILKKPSDGWEAEKKMLEANHKHASMATIGG